MQVRPSDNVAPWKQRFLAPKIFWSQLRPEAPDRGLVATNLSGKIQLHAWDVPSGALRQVTTREEGVAGGFLSPDGRYIYYLDDHGGNEIGHFVRVPFEGTAREDVTPDLDPYSSFGLSFSRAGNLVCFVAATGGSHLTCVDVGQDGSLGTARRVYRTDSFVEGPVVSHGGEIAVLGSTERTGTPDLSLVALDTRTGAEIAELWDGPGSGMELGPFSPVPGDTRMLAATDRSGARRPFIWNPATGERRELDLPDVDGEVRALAWSHDASQLLLLQFHHAVQRLYLYDLDAEKLKRLQHPDGTYWAAYFAPGGEIFAQWTDAANPPQLIALHPETGEKLRTVLAAGGVPASRPFRSVSFPSSGGQMIQGWLALPNGEGPFPTILDMHGGPQSAATNGFAPGAQAWLDHGFAFLTINYRGSTTFGREFEQQIWGNPGDREVDDMAAARDWLVANGIAAPDQVLLTGWSYGGYLTLQALGRRPELWAGGMAGIAITDWRLQYEDSAEMLKGYQAAMFGGTPDEKPDQYAASSPITYAEQVSAPVLLIQGRNDTRCPARPVELYEAKLKALGKPIEVHWFEAGHGSRSVDLDIKHHELMLHFAHRVLG